MGNKLIIGDLHAPFIKEGYLSHCRKIYKRFNCTSVHCTGDVLDNHYSSFHDTDPDGHGGRDEFNMGIKQLKKFHKAFPRMTISLGNHDNIPNRKGFNAGLSNVWVKSVQDMFNEKGFDGWKFAPRFFNNGILYTHGVGGKAKQRGINEGCSVVQGHIHTESYVNVRVTQKDMMFSLQVGCGVDYKAYALAYAKDVRKPIISCGVVLNDYMGTVEPMVM